MADVSAKDVAALRKITGAGMMDCKKALGECDGDMNAAKDWLREKGLAGASKREGRSADQGTVDVTLDGSVAALVEVNCETDFVAKGPQFKQLVADLVALVRSEGDEGIADKKFAGATVGEELAGLSATLGEKIELGRIARYETSDGVLDAYKHVQNERGVIGVLVEVTGAGDGDKARAVAHDLALHIASAAPRYVSRADVPEADIEHERGILEAQTREEGKPDQAIPKIVEGKLGGYFKQVVLLEQPFVRDNKVTIAGLLEALGSGAAVKRFVRVKIGEE
ncbi:MAG TPA: translation elongation factor Ts [Acidimicrobiia bacterium]|jgi:elongation factor Ts|nr:translation elongation factor Ts [Acidimicrobiia bacterium]